MTFRKKPPIPAPYLQRFDGAIRHPQLHLWDSWVMRADDKDHLYCLALNRNDHDGSTITPYQCNEYQFHFRHFESGDRGTTWTDRGVALKPGNIADGSDAGNVWSGGVLPLEDGRVLFGFTGISDDSVDHQFVQSINLAIGDVDGPKIFARKAASHPVRDRQSIIDMGYYLPPAAEIGHNNGEEGGPITAWRDPFFHREENGEIYAFWSAKLGPQRPAVAWGKVSVKMDVTQLDLLPPISLPDDTEYTQSEVPKICKHIETGAYFMMISACNRIDEAQPDTEVFKQLRLYKSQSLAGPWEPYNAHSSILESIEHLFGASFMETHFNGSAFRLVAPYTVKIGPELALSFAPVTEISV